MSYNGQLGQSQLMVFAIMPVITVFYNNIIFVIACIDSS